MNTITISAICHHNKVDQIKTLRMLSGLGLKEAKDIVDSGEQFDLSLMVESELDGLTIKEYVTTFGGTRFCLLSNIKQYFESQNFRVHSNEHAPVKRNTLDLFSHNYSQLSDAITDVGGSFSFIREKSLDEFLHICAMNGVELTAKIIR